MRKVSLENTQAYTAPYCVYFEQVDDVVFEDVNVLGATGANGGNNITGIAFDIDEVVNGQFRNCHINGFTSVNGDCNGFLIWKGSSNLTFENCGVNGLSLSGTEGNLSAFKILDSSDITISQSIVKSLSNTTSGGSTGIFLGSANTPATAQVSNVIRECSILNVSGSTSGTGIAAQPGSTQSMIENNRVLNCSSGGVVDTTGNTGAEVNLYAGNEARGNGGSGASSNNFNGMPIGTVVSTWDLSQGGLAPITSRLWNVSVI